MILWQCCLSESLRVQYHSTAHAQPPRVRAHQVLTPVEGKLLHRAKGSSSLISPKLHHRPVGASERARSLMGVGRVCVKNKRYFILGGRQMGEI